MYLNKKSVRNKLTYSKPYLKKYGTMNNITLGNNGSSLDAYGSGRSGDTIIPSKNKI